ncbi:hypothetical protein ACFQ3L_07600 [Lacticaseibacillus jixianensis]|uniref:BIG2 domain-containing protein n=1 Tax=Lacticaseibacillus jixianensis TaxID=2486012 RepID=A0ABW4BB60_9LACO|nr:hypothetical protein [Lacticaseibacillus jixianensis]
MQFKTFWASVGAVIFLMLGAPGHQVHAAIPSVTPPDLGGTLAGFHAPTPVPTSGGASYFSVGPYWATNTGSGDVNTNWTIVVAGTPLQLKAQAVKGLNDFAGVPALNLDVQAGSGPVVSFLGNWSGNSALTAAANQLGLTYLTWGGWAGEATISSIAYGVMAPDVTVPTWYTYQPGVRFQLPLGLFGLSWYFYAKPIKLLVIPKNFAPTLTAQSAVLFAGQSTMIGTPGLDPAIVPTYSVAPNATVQTAAQGNQLRAVASGAVGTASVTAHFVLAPMFNGGPALDLTTPALPLYTGNLAGEDVPEGDSGIFTIQLPAGLSAVHTQWYLNGIVQPGQTGSSLTVPDATEDGTVYAVTDIMKGGTVIATGVRTNDAHLNLLPVRSDYRLRFDVPFLYAKVGPDSPLGRTDHLQASVIDLPAGASQVTWAAYEPGTRTPSSLVKVDQSGQVTATAQTGAVDITADFQVAGAYQRSVRRVNVVALPDRQTAAGTALALSAPSNLPDLLAGSTISYEWHLAGTSQALAGTPAAVTPAASYQLARVTSADSGSAYQLVVRITTNGETQEVISNVADITVDPPEGLALQAVPSFNFAKPTANSFQPPTVAEIINGAGTLENANTGSRQLIISDNRGAAAGPWQLSVALDQFQSISSFAPISPTPDFAALALTLSGDPPVQSPPIWAGGDAVTLAAATAAVRVWDTTGRLMLQPLKAPLAGSYGSQVHWTLSAAPLPSTP